MINRKRILKIANVRSIITFGIISTLFMLLFVYKLGQNEHDKTLKAAKNNLEQTAKIISTNVELSFISVDQTLQRAAERQYFNMLFGKTLKSDMEYNLSLWVNQTPHISAMMFTDEFGAVEILFVKGEQNFQVKPGYKFSVKEHFDKHRNAANLGMLITAASEEQGNHIFASRRIEKIDGSFGGLVVAVIDGDYINKFVETIEHEKNINAAVVLDEGSALIGESEKFKTSLESFNELPLGEINISEKNINNKIQLFSYQHLKTLPLSVLLAVDEKNILAPFNNTISIYVTFASIFTGFVAMVIFFVLLLDKKMHHIKISEQKALTASQAKSEFLAKMSHELRTPLNAIIGFSEMLSTGYFGKVNTDQVDRLRDINVCGSHLLDLISDILDFSKGEAGKLTLKEELVNVYTLVNETFKVIEQKAKKKNVEVVNAVARQVNGIYADKKKVKQILINLLSNSVKFTESGGKVIVSTHFDKEHNFVLTVSDTGRGIEQKDIPRALAVFEQVHSDSAEQGSGLGLPLCQMFAEMHGGNFRLESKVGVGTTAYATIPQMRVRKPTVEEEVAEVVW
jgi:signal transduction histidine kinase